MIIQGNCNSKALLALVFDKVVYSEYSPTEGNGFKNVTFYEGNFAMT